MSDSSSMLVLLRHGESEFNAQDRFAGWMDVELTERGRAQARQAGGLLSAHDLVPRVVYTSELRRAVDTAVVTMAAWSGREVPMLRTWRLNERHYGAFQGRTRSSVRASVGASAFHRVRRFPYARPPEVDTAGASGVLPGEVPALRGESLEDVRIRLLPLWFGRVLPDLRAERTVLLVAHGNVIRCLRWHLQGLSLSELVGLEVPTGRPLVCRIDLRTGRAVDQPTHLAENS